MFQKVLFTVTVMDTGTSAVYIHYRLLYRILSFEVFFKQKIGILFAQLKIDLNPSYESALCV